MQPEVLYCEKCRGVVGERLPGGALRMRHGGREFTLYAAAAAAYFETTCGHESARGHGRGAVCGHRNRLCFGEDGSVLQAKPKQ